MRVMFRRKRREQGLDRELRDHLELEAEEQRNPDVARRTLGHLARIKEDVREVWGWTAFHIKALNDFLAWHSAEPGRPLAERSVSNTEAFWNLPLLAPASINLRLSAIRKPPKMRPKRLARSPIAA
jgi:hypothetical protein